MFLNYLGEVYYWLLKPIVTIGTYPLVVISNLGNLLPQKFRGLIDGVLITNLLQISTVILLWEIANFLMKKMKALGPKDKLKRLIVLSQLVIVILLIGFSLVLLFSTHLRPTFILSENAWGYTVIVSFFLMIFVGLANAIRYLLLGIGYAVRLSTKVRPGPKMKRFWKLLLVILGVYPFLTVLSVFLWMYTDIDSIRGREFFTLHAAIKNTCILDQNKVNCPQTLQEIKYIEPEEFAKAEACCQMNYQYDPKTNQYTFIVRYSPLNAVVFDQRLVEQYRIDLKEFSVDINFLKSDRLKNPPGWAGPWNFPDWKYFE